MSENQLAAGLNKLITAGLLFLPEDAVRSLFAGAPPSSMAGARASDCRGARTILRPLLAVLILNIHATLQLKIRHYLQSHKMLQQTKKGQGHTNCNKG